MSHHTEQVLTLVFVSVAAVANVGVIVLQVKLRRMRRERR